MVDNNKVNRKKTDDRCYSRLSALLETFALFMLLPTTSRVARIAFLCGRVVEALFSTP
jgi:hypothetical protein